MSQHNTKELNELEPYDDDSDDIEISNTDYGFIVTATGELKTFFCPDIPDGWPPKEVLKIFKIFKIHDLSEVIPHMLSMLSPTR